MKDLIHLLPHVIAPTPRRTQSLTFKLLGIFFSLTGLGLGLFFAMEYLTPLWGHAISGLAISGVVLLLGTVFLILSAMRSTHDASSLLEASLAGLKHLNVLQGIFKKPLQSLLPVLLLGGMVAGVLSQKHSKA